MVKTGVMKGGWSWSGQGDGWWMDLVWTGVVWDGLGWGRHCIGWTWLGQAWYWMDLAGAGMVLGGLGWGTEMSKRPRIPRREAKTWCNTFSIKNHISILILPTAHANVLWISLLKAVNNWAAQSRYESFQRYCAHVSWIVNLLNAKKTQQCWRL